jgi:hypothetical protein
MVCRGRFGGAWSGGEHVGGGVVRPAAESVHLAGAVGFGLEFEFPQGPDALGQSRRVGEQIGQHVDVLTGPGGDPAGCQPVEHHHLTTDESPAALRHLAGEIEDQLPQDVERTPQRRQDHR